MTERQETPRERRRYPSLTWPVILITAGVLILLNNIGVLNVSLWELWRLWPVLLILAGLEILLGRRSFLGSMVATLVTVTVVAGVVILLLATPDLLAPSRSGTVDHIDEPLDGIERADLEVHFGAGRLKVEALSDSSSLISGELELSARSEPSWELNRKNDQALMTLKDRRGSWSGGWNWKGADEWRLRLSPKVGLSLDVELGAGTATLDLTGLDIRDLKVTAGASQSTIILPGEGDVTARISSGVGQLILEIPDEMAARVQIDRGIAAIAISRRFRRDGNTYVTDDWETNRSRVDLKIDVGVGQVTLR